MTWPKRVRVPGDMGPLTSAGCTEYARGLGRKDGFYLASEKLAVDGMRESFSQKRDQEAARAMRLQWGALMWQTVVTAYAEERLREIEAENVIHAKRKATDAEA